MKREDKKRTTKKQSNTKKINKEEKAVIRTNTRANILRVALYILLGFVFIRGMVSIISATPGEEIVQAQKDFMQSVDSNTSKQVMVSTFAEGFIKNYCTYKKKSEEDYKRRLEPFTGAELSNEITSGIRLVDDADAVYTQTLAVEKISDAQYDVTVMVDIIYTRYPTPGQSSATPKIDAPNEQMAQQEEINPFSQRQTLYYKVPIYFKNNNYAVEDYPILTVQPRAVSYQKQMITYIEISDIRKKEIQTLADDFTKALFEESQNKINYYLADVKNTSNFGALQTTLVKYSGIQDIMVYEVSPDKYLAVVTAKTEDINGSTFRQKYTLSVVKKDRYLIENLLLRTHSLNV